MFFPYEGTKAKLQYEQLVKFYPEITEQVIKELFLWDLTLGLKISQQWSISQDSHLNPHKTFSSFDAQSNTKPKPYNLAHLLGEYVTFKVME